MSAQSLAPRISRRNLLLWSGAGVALATPGVWCAAVRLLPREGADLLVLTLRGPFEHRKTFLDSYKETPWIHVNYVGTVHDPKMLDVRFCFLGEDNPRQVIRFQVHLTAKDGKTYKVLDDERRDVREEWGLGPKHARNGRIWSEMACPSQALPVGLSEIARLDLRFEHRLLEPGEILPSEQSVAQDSTRRR